MHFSAACSAQRAGAQFSDTRGASQAARIIANLIIAGGGVLLRAAAQAYRQALISELPAARPPLPLLRRPDFADCPLDICC